MLTSPPARTISGRSNFAGEVPALGVPDLTARDVVFGCDGGAVTSLTATICNRGARPALAGQPVHFVDESDAVLCEASTAESLVPGECVEISCEAGVAAGTEVIAVVNPDATTRECDLESNFSAPALAGCQG